MIQFQYIDFETHENLGGLYVNSKHISSVRNHKPQLTVITLVCGKEFLVPFSVSEILEKI